MKKENILNKIKAEAKILKEINEKDFDVKVVAEKIEKKEKEEKNKKKIKYDKLLEQRTIEEVQIIMNSLHQSRIIPDPEYPFFSVFDFFKRTTVNSKLQIIIAKKLSELEKKVQDFIKKNYKNKIIIHNFSKQKVIELQELNSNFAECYNLGKIGTVEVERDDDKNAKIIKPRTYSRIRINYSKLKNCLKYTYEDEYPRNKYYTYLNIPVYKNIRFIKLLEIID